MTGTDRWEWLEDAESPRTLAWIAAQRDRTERFLRSCEHRDAIRARLAELWRAALRRPPLVRGRRLFFEENDGSRERAALFMQDGIEGRPRMLLDPASRGPEAALADWMPSPDGSRVAVALSQAGSDWRTWHVVDASDGAEIDGPVPWSKFSCAAWSPDGSAFAYECHGPARTAAGCIRVHRLGEPAARDAIAVPAVEGDRVVPFARVPGRSLVLKRRRGTSLDNDLVVIDWLDQREPRTLFTGRAGSFNAFGRVGDDLLVLATEGAPRGRILHVDVETGTETEILAEAPSVLVSAQVAGDRLLVLRRDDGLSRLAVHELDGLHVADVALPGLGTVDALTGGAGGASAFAGYESFQQPPMVLRIDPRTATASAWWEPELRFQPSRYVTRQELVPSVDGTEVPVVFAQREDLSERSALPAYLYGYGGFNNPVVPRFSISALTWMEMGGVFAQALIRGGGERGEAWHRAAVRENRPRAYEDFESVARWLQDSGWAARGRVAITGHSNGGLLVAACLTRAPGLFGAAVPTAGVHDMLRFHLFTIGWAWKGEYGDPDEPADREFLRGYSPLHNVKAGESYPPTLVSASEGDDRVVPAHSYKLAAALQEAQAGPAPILARIEPRSGHGAGDAITRIVEEFTDRLTFLGHAFGMGPPLR